ncbi:MAG: tetratricopeptide repeat protein [Chitinophagaceae bacterium]
MNRIERIEQFLKEQPKDNFLRHALALEYVKLGDDAKAKELFVAIVTEFPDYVGTYYHLAKLLERENNTTDALAWYEKGMEQAKLTKDQHAYNELQAAYEDLAY